MIFVVSHDGPPDTNYRSSQLPNCSQNLFTEGFSNSQHLTLGRDLLIKGRGEGSASLARFMLPKGAAVERHGLNMLSLNFPVLDGTLILSCSEREPTGQSTIRPAAQARLTFRSKLGLEIEVVELSESRFVELVDMYEVFEPKRGAQGLPPMGRERIVAWLRHLQIHGHNLLALSDGRVIGHSMLCPVDAERAEFAVFLDQDFRNQGIGTRLTEATLDHARHLNFRNIWLSVEMNNPCAIRVYRKTGFQVSGLFGPEQEMALDLVIRSKADEGCLDEPQKRSCKTGGAIKAE